LHDETGQALTAIKIDPSWLGKEPPKNEALLLEQDRSTAVFRIFQKALTNVAGHAGATRVGVNLNKRVGRLLLEVADGRKEAQQRLADAFIDLTETVSRAMETRDPYTAGHQRKVAALARLVGEKLGLSPDELQGLYIGALLQYIGKIAIPESILTKPGRLSEEEWSLIQVHTRQGHDTLKETTLPWPVAEMALHHHERLDGSGYPGGLSGDDLTREVRILGVCDVVEAMSFHRPYRLARSRAEVLEEIKGGRDTKYDARIADAMVEVIEGGALERAEMKQ
jgi:putative two-component system response regulator